MSFKSYLKNSTKNKPQTGVQRYGIGQPITTNYKYRDIVIEAYQRNPYIYAALNKIADIYADMPIKLRRMDTQGEYMDLDQHPVLDLINKPNSQQGKTLFMKTKMIYLMLGGSCAIRKYSPTSGNNAGKPKELWNIQPDAIKPIADSVTGSIGSFEMVSSGDRIDRKDIIYIQELNPLNSEEGFSPVMSAQLFVDVMNEMAKWNLATTQNQGIPSLWIYNENGDLSESDARKIKDRFIEQNTGWYNAREPFVSQGGLKIERIGQNSQEMDWLESMKWIAEPILTALGVSKDAIIGGSTFENRKEAMKDLINNTVMPKAKMFVEAYNNQLLPDYGDNLELYIDKSQIELLQESQNDLWDRVIKAFESGLLSVGESRLQLNKDQDVEHSDQFYMNTGRQAVASDLNEEDLK